jgi:hypothetical protein
MKPRNRLFAGAIAFVFMAGVASAPIAASASEEGRRNTTLGLGALTGYLFTRGGNKVPAFVGAAATAYAYKRYDDSIKARHKRERAARARRYSRTRSYRR